VTRAVIVAPSGVQAARHEELTVDV
jgi:hypothetical protein